MQYLRNPLLWLSLLVLTATALPIQDQGLAIEERATTQEKQTAAKQVQSGIKQNIKIQNSELKDVHQVSKEEKEGDKKGFTAAKTTLTHDIDRGVDQRKMNQQQNKIAGNKKVAEGLDTVSKAQAAEKKEANSLTGHQKTDQSTVKKLETMFKGGIQKNKDNLKASQKGGR